MEVHYTCILGRTYLVERSIHLIEEHWLLIITGVQASRVIIDRLLRQYFFVWSEIVGPHSSGNFNIEVLLFEMEHSLKGYLFHMFFRFKLPDTVNPLLTPPGSYLFQTCLRGGLNRDGGLIREWGLFNLTEMVVSGLHRKLEYKVEKLKYKRFEVT